MPLVEVNPVCDLRMRALCVAPYEGHGKGCPNFGVKPGCPPTAPLLSEHLDLSKKVWTVYNVFALGDHVAALRKRHPDWSRRQLECCLYWQGRARHQLEIEIAEVLRQLGMADWRVVRRPEAMGVNVTATMAQVGINLEWPPCTRAVQVALVGTSLRRSADDDTSAEVRDG